MLDSKTQPQLPQPTPMYPIDPESGHTLYHPTPEHVFVRFGEQIIKSKVRGWTRSFSLSQWKPYFEVNNSYVKNKIKVLLFPCGRRNWRRVAISPCDDINAPDLYLPMVGLATYVLLAAMIMELHLHAFTPTKLGEIACASVESLVAEVVILRCGLYLLGIPPPPLLEAFAIVGYKYIGADVVLVLVLILPPSACYTSVFVAIRVMNSYVFVVRTMIQNNHALATSESNVRTKFLVFIGVLQILIVWIWG